eukprot:1574966-Prymnesium_polylepis.2
MLIDRSRKSSLHLGACSRFTRVGCNIRRTPCASRGGCRTHDGRTSGPRGWWKKSVDATEAAAACPPRPPRCECLQRSIHREALRLARLPSCPTHGDKRFGSRGKSDVLRMLGRARKSITTRSSPMPPPACGNAPYLNEST